MTDSDDFRVVWMYRMDFDDGHEEWILADSVSTAVSRRMGGRYSPMPRFCWNMTMWERMRDRIAELRSTPWPS